MLKNEDCFFKGIIPKIFENVRKLVRNVRKLV